jgi:predicted HicB family RNase H-like nuclease
MRKSVKEVILAQRLAATKTVTMLFKKTQIFSSLSCLRTTPDTHTNLAAEAARRGTSLNDLVNERLSK